MIENILVHQELGNIKVGQKTTVVYYIPKDIPVKVVHLATSCGCTEARYVDNGESRYITVSYTPSSIPRHLEKQGFYTVQKSITALFHMETSETTEIKLSFHATIIK